jgi:hypothetical protein
LQKQNRNLIWVICDPVQRLILPSPLLSLYVIMSLINSNVYIYIYIVAGSYHKEKVIVLTMYIIILCFLCKDYFYLQLTFSYKTSWQSFMEEKLRILLYSTFKSVFHPAVSQFLPLVNTFNIKMPAIIQYIMSLLSFQCQILNFGIRYIPINIFLPCKQHTSTFITSPLVILLLIKTSVRNAEVKNHYKGYALTEYL